SNLAAALGASARRAQERALGARRRKARSRDRADYMQIVLFLFLRNAEASRNLRAGCRRSVPRWFGSRDCALREREAKHGRERSDDRAPDRADALRSADA